MWNKLKKILKKIGEKISNYILGILLDPDSWIGVAVAVVIIFVIPATFLKFIALGLCGYLIVKPNARKDLFKGFK